MSLSQKIIISLLLGVFIGIFFGEYCSFLSVFGDGFIGLLQMTVLPYIMVSIILNLGRMSLEDGKTLVFNGLKVLAFLLAIGIITLIALPLSLPEWTASSFFQPSSVVVEEPLNLLDLYIPSNPFGSMANNVVPAVVLFSIFLGIGLSKIKGKETVLQGLDVIGEALNHINKIIIKLTPIGVFFIAAYNAGTMSFEEIQRLQAYIIIYSVAVLLLGFYWLPLLVYTFTGIKPAALFRATKSTLLTIFATGKIIVVLPQLMDDVKRLLIFNKEKKSEASAITDILMPLAYPFPNLGTFVIFVFVPFVGWYVGNPFGWIENSTFVGATLLSSFVAPVTGIPFLLNLLKLPQEMFQLFVISSVYTDRIRVVLGAIHLIVLTIITVRMTLGGLKINWTKLIRGTIIGVVLTVVALIGTRYYLSFSLGKSQQYESFIQMKLSRDFKNGSIKNVSTLLSDSTYNSTSNQIQAIKNRGRLRVGYLANQLPFAFNNDEANAIGLDIEMAYHLANELGVKPEFYKVTNSQMIQLLKNRKLDIVMSGLVVSTDMLKNYAISTSYLDQTLAFIVPDYNRNKFKSKDEILKQDSLKIGISNPYFRKKFKEYLPNAKIIKLSSPRDFFKSKTNDLDAYLFSAESGGAWTIIYPEFNVAIPQPTIIKVPMAYPLPRDESWILYVNTWIELKKKDGTIDKLFSHYIEGKGADIPEPRWSIIKDVLHWVE
ncbi:amino acid ABC transporter substrate-binding protein, PAAT family [Lutibacter agarilyticus]|uniref:Amino acid ABC transporter substrate-binding protein, PAAT family n=1 Tax=Lutibacter agarilyticus TaxID=1109740 RepID=A0A238VF32_9FLAO|nr:cation:dicarboxylase symporter family transporter [Lutibacter agarilyticus]SNR32774.1 amino acid ABC transporter substrate-binding protein, PAAT family [Lutibacter agarilyticus]